METVKDENVNEEVTAQTAEATTETQQAPQQEQRNVLLGTISYTNEADYEKFLASMDINQAMFVLIASANYGQAKGLFNLDESELVARAIKTIKKNSTAPATSETSNS